MSGNVTRTTAAGLFVVVLSIGSALGQDDKGADQARKAIALFGARLAANDLDGVLKATDASLPPQPDGPPKKEVVRDREGQKKLLQELLKAVRQR